VDDYGTGGTSVIGNNLVLNKNLVVSTDGYYDGSSYVYSSLTINGNINDNDGRRDITKTGIGTLTLAGGEGWFITGNIDVQAGTLVAQGWNALGRGHTEVDFASRTVTVEAGATLAFGASDIYDNAHRSIAVPDIIVNGGTLATINEGVHAAVNNVTLNNGTMTSTTDGWKDGLAWHLNGTLTSSGNSTINYTAGGGNISLQNGDVENPSTTFNVVDGTLSVDASLYNGLDNGGNYRATGLVKTGGGMLRLNRRNGEAHGFSGNIDIQGGTLMVGDYLGLGVNRYDAPGRTISVEAGATLAFARGDIYNGGHESTDMPDIFVNGGTISTAEGGAHIALNNITLNDGTMKSGTDGWVANWHLNGTVTSTGNSQMIIDSGANQAHRVMLKSSGTESERQTTFEVQSGMLTIEPMLTDGFDGGSFRTTGLVKTGNGTLNLNCDSWSNDIHFYNGDASTDRDDAGHAFSGNIDVQAGTLLVSGERALGLGRNNAPNRTVTVETGATLAFARGDVYGGHTTQDMPNLYVKGTLETLGSGTHVEVYSVTLDNGTMTSTTDGWDAYAWHFNGDITSKGASVINYLGGSGRITLHSGDDMTTPTTTFDVQDGSLTVTSPIIDGLAGNGSSRATGLKKIGEGLLDLTGSDLSYTGNTTVDAGRMDVDVLNTPNATVYVASGAELNASSIVADTLSIGGPVLGPVVVVPEPSTLVLLALAGLGAIVAAWRRK
jgi:autotransporter-associated beta strand protein